MAAGPQASGVNELATIEADAARSIKDIRTAVRSLKKHRSKSRETASLVLSLERIAGMLEITINDARASNVMAMNLGEVPDLTLFRRHLHGHQAEWLGLKAQHGL